MKRDEKLASALHGEPHIIFHKVSSLMKINWKETSDNFIISPNKTTSEKLNKFDDHTHQI